MQEKLTSVAVRIYASAVLYDALRRHPRDYNAIVEKNKLIAAARKFAEPHKYKNISIFLDVDINEWKYIDENKKKLFNSWVKEDLTDDSIRCDILFVKNQKLVGQYFPVENKIEIYLNISRIYDVDNFNYNIELIISSVRHELQHFAQFLLSKLSRIDYNIPQGKPGNMTGLPSRKIRSKDQDYYGHYLMPNQTSDQASEHDLHDSEFYTNLADTIHEFVVVARAIPREIRQELAKAWVGENSNYKKMYYSLPYLTQVQINKIIKNINVHRLFKALREKDIGKWKKAVKEFYSAVSYLF